MRRMSIGLRLTFWYFAFFAIALILFGTGMWFSVRHSMFRVVKQNLNDNVQGVERFLENQPADFSLARLQHETDEEYAAENEGDFLQITDEHGQLIYQAVALRSVVLPATLPSAEGFDHVVINERHLLFLTRTVVAHGTRYVVQTGMPLRDVYGSLARFRRSLLLFVPMVLIIASGFGYWISRRALRPVRQITEAARTIGAQSLGRRLEMLHSGDELQGLSETLNEMFARLEASFSRITQFTADASHELRTPVTLIRTEAELAIRKSRTEAEYREALQHILAEAEKTTRLIEELLALARADSGTENLRLQPAETGELLREVTGIWAQAAEARGLQLAVDAPTNPLWTMADSAAMQRVLGILLDNAIRYTPSPGEIRIAVAVDGSRLNIDVQDSGIGISAEDLPRIFERFYRADPARHRESGGVGLGLAIAQWIVKQHAGQLEVSHTPGNGTRFRVSLPLLPEPAITSVAIRTTDPIAPGRG